VRSRQCDGWLNAARAVTSSINKEQNTTTYPQSDTQIPAFAPGQNSVGTGGQNSIGADMQARYDACLEPRKTSEEEHIA
jgi:hypothetical protein